MSTMIVESRFFIKSEKHPGRWIANKKDVIAFPDWPITLIGTFDGEFRVFIRHHAILDVVGNEQIGMAYRQAASDHQLLILDI